MKSKTLSLLSFSILAMIILMSFATAGVDFTNVTGNSQSVNHGEEVEVTFILEEDGNGDITDLSFDTLITLSGCSETFDASITTAGAPTSLGEDEVSGTVAVNFDIPEYQSACTYTGDLTLNGVYTNTVNYDLALSITVDSTPSISISDAIISTGGNSATITITNDGNIGLEHIELTASGDFDVSLNIDDFDLASEAEQEVVVTITSDLSDLGLSANSISITATADDDTAGTGTISTEGSACEFTDNGNLKVKIKDITVIDGFGDDEEWFPLDEIEVEIEVENRGSEDMDDIVLEWGLYDTNNDEWYVDEEESDFNLNDDEDERITITFKLDDDIDDLENGDYVFYVWATGEDDEFDGVKTCVSASQDIEIITEDNFVILYDISYSEVASCGTEVQIMADVWNIGDEDQDDVYIEIFNIELGISEEIIIGDIDAFDHEELNAVITIPEDAKEKLYQFTAKVYDEDNDVYENDFDDEESDFPIGIRLDGCGVAEKDVVVSANLESGGNAGEELIIEVTITNTGDESVTYSLNAAGYSEWASGANLDQNTIVIDAGDSEDVLITFDVKADASGNEQFDIEIVSDNELLAKQPVEVSITAAETGGLFSGITGGAVGNSSYLWGIGLLNIILVVIIIVVAVRIARR